MPKVVERGSDSAVVLLSAVDGFLFQLHRNPKCLLNYMLIMFLLIAIFLQDNVLLEEQDLTPSKCSCLDIVANM